MSVISFESLPSGDPAREKVSLRLSIQTDLETDDDNEALDVDVDTELLIGDPSAGTLSDSGEAGEEFTFNYTNAFPEPGDYPLRATATVEYSGASNDQLPDNNPEELDIKAVVTIGRSIQSRQEDPNVGEDYSNAFDDRSPTKLINIESDEDQEDSLFDDGSSQIDFAPYNNPNVAVSSSARFAVHDIIGGTTVRQKLGDDPLEISIDGVCTEEVANKIDALRRAKVVEITSDRLSQGLVRCQVVSTSTDPFADGGGADLKSSELLYDFSIDLVEVRNV